MYWDAIMIQIQKFTMSLRRNDDRIFLNVMYIKYSINLVINSIIKRKGIKNIYSNS